MGELENWLGWQDGVVSRHQLLRAGLTEQRLRTKLKSGQLVRVHPGVYRGAGHPQTYERRVRAAVMWAGHGVPGAAALIGPVAAWWWGLTEVRADRIHIAVGATAHFRPRQGMLLRRISLDRQDLTTYRLLPIAGLPHSALFGAVDLGRAGPAMLDRALQGRVRLAELQQTLQRNRGSTGAARAAELLAAASDGAAAESERLLGRLLRAAGITGWQPNEVVITGQPWVGDFVFRRARLVVEVDGWAWHHTPERFQQDRTRQNLLVAAGWTVLRFTWFDLTDRPQEVIAQIAERSCCPTTAALPDSATAGRGRPARGSADGSRR